MPFSPIVAVVLLTGIQCGPTDQEVAGGVLIAAPAAMALGFLLFKGLYAQAARHTASLEWRQRPVLVATGVSAVIAIATAIALSHTRLTTTIGPALWVFSASYLALLAVVWMYWVRVNPSQAFTWAWLPVAALQLVPAILVAAGFMSADWVGILWIWPGYFGAITLAAVLTAWRQARRGRRR